MIKLTLKITESIFLSVIKNGMYTTWKMAMIFLIFFFLSEKLGGGVSDEKKLLTKILI